MPNGDNWEIRQEMEKLIDRERQYARRQRGMLAALIVSISVIAAGLGAGVVDKVLENHQDPVVVVVSDHDGFMVDKYVSASHPEIQKAIEEEEAEAVERIIEDHLHHNPSSPTPAPAVAPPPAP